MDDEQFLTNIVRLRYIEAPRELAVSSVATQYEVSASTEARPFFNAPNPSGATFRTFAALLPFVSVGASNRPTVSMVPQGDATSTRQLLTPISTETIIMLGQSGWPVSTILRVWVDRLNGIPNWVPSTGPIRSGSPDFERFVRACELLQVIQDKELISLQAEEHATEISGPLPADSITAAAAVEAAKAGFEYRPRDDGKAWALVKRETRLVFRVNPAGQASPEFAELLELLNLKPGEEKYELMVASGVPDPAKVPSDRISSFRITPRSTSQALFFLSNGVEVPPAHVMAGLIQMPPDGSDPCDATRGVFRVHSCPGRKHKRPACAFVATHYRDHWFYIDDRDAESKATFFLVTQLRRLDFKRQEIGAVPALTLAVGR